MYVPIGCSVRLLFSRTYTIKKEFEYELFKI